MKLKAKESEFKETEDELKKSREINEKLANALADKYEEDKSNNNFNIFLLSSFHRCSRMYMDSIFK